MRNHVHDVDAAHLRLRQVDAALAAQPQLEGALDHGLAEEPRAQAIGGELLAREVQQPDIPFQLAFLRQLHEDRRRQQQRGGGRVIVVGARGGHAHARAALVVLIHVFHVSRIIVVGHDDGLAAVLPGDHHQDVALCGLAGLIAAPAAIDREIEHGLPAERQVAAQRLALHARGRDQRVVTLDEIVAELLQVAVLVRQLLLGERVLRHIGIILVHVAAVREQQHLVPQRRFERAVGSARERQRLRRRLRLARQQRIQLLLELARPLGMRSALGQRGEPGLQRFVFGDAQQLSREAARQRPGPQLRLRIQQRDGIERRLAHVMVVLRVEDAQRRQVWRPAQHARPQLHGTGEVGLCRAIGGEVAQRRIGQELCLVGARRPERCQRPVPVDCMRPHSHGGKEEAVSKQAARRERCIRAVDLLAGRLRAIQQQLKLVRPQLAVARHRLVVQAQRIRLSAEQYLADLVELVVQRQLVVVAMHAVPAMRAVIGVADQLALHLRRLDSRVRLVQPSSLRHADAVGTALPCG